MAAQSMCPRNAIDDSYCVLRSCAPCLRGRTTPQQTTVLMHPCQNLQDLAREGLFMLGQVAVARVPVLVLVLVLVRI